MNLKGLFWPSLIVSMLGANVTIVAVTYVAAKSGEGAMVSPGYDEQALRWDEQKLAIDRSRDLKWTCSVTVYATASNTTRGRLEVTLNDAAGLPIAGRTAQVQCFHSAHPSSIEAVSMTTDSTGVATASIHAERAGRYSIRITCPGVGDQPAYLHETEVSSLPLR